MPPLILTDDLGHAVSLDRPPRRIVSLVPSLTETLVRLGIGARLAGITEYCIHPAGMLAALPRVGGTKNVDVDAVRALEPDLVIANAEENEKPEIEELRTFTAVFVTLPKTVVQGIATVETLGTLTGTGESAAQWAAECRAEYERVRSLSPRKLRSVCLIWREPWMAAGPDTYISDLMGTCGFHNLLSAATERYPAVTLEELAALAPAVILLPDEPYRFDGSHAAEIAAALAASGCAPRMLPLDGTLLAWFGWRTREALAGLQALRASLEE